MRLAVSVARDKPPQTITSPTGIRSTLRAATNNYNAASALIMGHKKTQLDHFIEFFCAA